MLASWHSHHASSRDRERDVRAHNLHSHASRMPTDRSTPTPHDALFRAAFEHPAAAAGELVHVLPAPLAAVLDTASVRLELERALEKILSADTVAAVLSP